MVNGYGNNSFTGSRLFYGKPKCKKAGYLGGIAKPIIESKFDYWGWWKACVDRQISPSEAWKLDFVEVRKLLEQEDKSMDLSIMLNYERAANGASKTWLQKN